MQTLQTYFVGVDTEDQQLVKDRFPDAHIIEGQLSGEELVAQCKDAEILSVFIHSQITKEVLDQLPNLQLICTRSVGFNHIDLDACKEREIYVTNVPDYGSHVIAEHVFALLLSTLRHIPEAEKRVESGEFDYHGLRGISMRDKTIGIVGTGKIGRRVAQIAHGFGMRILAVDKCRVLELEDLLGVQYVSLEEALEQSDILSMHLPANEHTHHMLNADAFAAMKEGVVIVNTARGELIDSSALLEALNSGKVGHALLDVLEHEKNFEENEKLIKHENVVATPHIAFYAETSMRNMFEDCFASIDQYMESGEPEHKVHVWKKVCDLPGVHSK